MGYKKTDIDLDSAFSKIPEYEYAYISLISQAILCKTKDIPEVKWDECIEARFFSKEKEMHIFEGSDGLKAVCIEDLDGGESCISRFKLAHKFADIGKEIKVKEYLDFDEDGQIYVALTRLMEVV